MCNFLLHSLAVISLLATAFPSLAQTSRLRLAIMDFSAPSPSSDRGYADSSRKLWGDPGRMMSELLTTHLVKSGRFDVVERARLYQLLNEKQIVTGTAILGEQAKAVGQELGVQAIVAGGYAPSAYGYEVSARVVSVGDGSIMTTENALIPADPAWMDQSMGILAAKLAAPWSKDRGYVLDVFLESGRLPLLMIDLGTAQGARVGRQLEVSTAGDQIIHPVTREVLGTRDVPLATAQIIKTEKEYSYARVTDRTGVISTPVRQNDEGIDLGIERMQRVKLTDVQSDVVADADMSVLSVMKYVEIRSDIPDAKLLVDGKPVTLSNNSASVRMAAGTHLVELQVGQVLLSREVTVTRREVRPKEVAFREADLASAVSIEPPETTPPAQATTMVARTAPEMTDEDRKLDEKLLSMLPRPEVIDEQLRAARDDAVIGTFEAGLRALRYGYTKGRRSYLSIAAARFDEVVRLAPDLALGHFNLGLAKFYLDNFGDAKSAFGRAVALDKSLNEDVPLLWWDDFQTVGSGVFQYRKGTSAGMLLCDPADPYKVRDVVATFRFRFVTPRPDSAGFAGMGTAQRQGPDGCVHCGITSGGGSCYLSVIPQSDLRRQYIMVGNGSTNVGGGWHVAEHVVVGSTHSLYIDGRLMCKTEDERSMGWAGHSRISFWGDTPIDLDWVLVTRY